MAYCARNVSYDNGTEREKKSEDNTGLENQNRRRDRKFVLCLNKFGGGHKKYLELAANSRRKV
jgi:hypothetical protein